MTTSNTRDSGTPNPATGWGDALPLPLTPEAPPPEPTGAVMHSRQALRRASFNAARVDAETDHGVNQGADVTEVGGPKGPEPTRYNDWEQKGRCTDF